MKPNSLPVVKKLHVKVGDNVKVIGGADKGKISTVTRIYTHNSKVLLKDINLKTKHVKGKAEGEIGQIVQVGLQESFNTTLLHLMLSSDSAASLVFVVFSGIQFLILDDFKAWHSLICLQFEIFVHKNVKI